MRRRLLLAVAAVVLMSQSAMAGWYQVENFEGSIGPNPVHFSLQTYEFGSGVTVEGSYYLDDQLSPVAVYGTHQGSAIQLCEITGDDQFNAVIIQGSETPVDTTGCPFALTLDASGATGTWQADGASHPVSLKRVAKLDDTGAGEIEGDVAIPFWKQTATHMFSGIYTKTDAGICMEKLQVINKSTGNVDQEIAFDGEFCDAGAVMTPIYLNVEVYDEEGTPVISVNFRDSGMGYAVDYAVDPKTGLLSEK